MKRVGYWISEKKSKKLNFEENRICYRKAGVELVKLDLSEPLENQGPFDAILHKLADVQTQADAGFLNAQKYIQNIQDFISKHPECIILDPLESVRKLLDRFNQYNLVQECNIFKEDSDVFMPTFVELSSSDLETNKQKLADAKVTYPLVCKSMVAHGSKQSHKMAVIFNEEGLRDLFPPCVAQSFINHNAVLFKIYVIGRKQFIAQRPSLKNLYPGDEPTIFFDSHDVSKRDSSHFLNQLDASDLENSPVKPDIAKLCELGETIRRLFEMDLFGVDVIVDSETGRHAVIDINAFPGYDEVHNFFDVLLDHILEVFRERDHNSSKPGDSKDNHQVAAPDTSDVTSRKRLKSDPEQTDAFSETNINGGRPHIQKMLESKNGIQQFSNTVFDSSTIQESSVCSKKHFHDSINGLSSNGH